MSFVSIVYARNGGIFLFFIFALFGKAAWAVKEFVYF